MTHIIHAELVRLVRRRTLVGLVLAAVAFAAVASLSVASAATADASGGPSRQSGPSLATLEGTGGGTQAFAIGASFVGFLVFVTVIGLIASDLSGGTFRAMVLRDPHRLRVIVGKLVGILAVAAGALLLTEVLTFVASLALAPSQDISTDQWFTPASLGHALGDLGTVFAGVVGWAVFGTTLAVIFQSVPLALGVGFAWAGPFENIVVDSWTTGYRVFPGQILASLIRGGTVELGLGRAALTAAAYTAVAAGVALLIVSRRDVTS